MTKDSLLKWVRKSYSIAEIGVDGITYTCPKNGLYNLVIQTDKGQRIKKLCDENDLSFAADTVYRRVTQRGKEWKQVYLKKSMWQFIEGAVHGKEYRRCNIFFVIM